jgi:TolA-binding protein
MLRFALAVLLMLLAPVIARAQAQAQPQAQLQAQADDEGEEAEDSLPAAPGPAASPAPPAPTQGAAPRHKVLTAEMGDDEGAEGAQARFEAALALLRAGREREAAAALLRLAHEEPDDDITPDAIFEAAQLHEEQLGEPEAALRLYADLLLRYPQSRLVRRAQVRHDELQAGLRTGAAAYLAFQAAVREARSAQAIPRLEALLARHGDFVFADRARYLLGSAYHDAGREADAERALKEVLSRHPGSEWAPRAEQLLGQIALGRGAHEQARAYYRGLARHGGLWLTASAQGLHATDRAARRHRAALLCLGYLALCCVLLCHRAGPALRRPPFEFWYYLPVAACIWIFGLLGGGGPVARALLALGLGGAVLVWLGGAAAGRAASAGSSEQGRRAARIAALVAGALLRALAALALVYVILYQGGLLDVLLETLRNGPERDH